MPLLSRLRQWIVSFRPRMIPYYLSVAIIVDTLLLYVLDEVFRDTERSDESVDSWLILTGSQRPSDATGLQEVIAASLAIAGYLFLPAIVALGINIGLSDWKREQSVSLDDLRNEMEARMRGVLPVPAPNGGGNRGGNGGGRGRGAGGGNGNGHGSRSGNGARATTHDRNGATR